MKTQISCFEILKSDFYVGYKITFTCEKDEYICTITDKKLKSILFDNVFAWHEIAMIHNQNYSFGFMCFGVSEQVIVYNISRLELFRIDCKTLAEEYALSLLQE